MESIRPGCLNDRGVSITYGESSVLKGTLIETVVELNENSLYSKYQHLDFTGKVMNCPTHYEIRHKLSDIAAIIIIKEDRKFKKKLKKTPYCTLKVCLKNDSWNLIPIDVDPDVLVDFVRNFQETYH